MAKNWKTIFSSDNYYNDNINTITNKNKKYEKLMGRTEKKDIKELRKEGNDYYNEDQLKREDLIYAFDNHMLKSNRLIKEAILIKKSKNKKGEKNGGNN